MGGLLTIVVCGISFLFAGDWWSESAAGTAVQFASVGAFLGGGVLLLVKAALEIAKEW